MPSVTDIQQQSALLNATEKSTPPPPTQQVTSMDSTNADPLTQAILVLEKKQRNLGKRKEKLEGYQEEAKKGKELNKDQKDALAKYSDVLGQIECVKELNEQFKKIQTETSKNQKRLSKQVAEEKRLLISQSLRQYAQIRYLLEHRPLSIKSEESSLLDQLSAVILPSDNSLNSISLSIDTVLSIYQNGPSSTIKSLTGKNPQEVREILEELIQNLDKQQISSSSSSSSSEQEQEQEPIKELEQTNDIQLLNTNLNEYSLQFDTRNQNISLEQIIQDNTFFSIDLNNQIQENNRDQSPDPKQYIPTITVVNSNINDQPPSSSSTENQQKDEQQFDGPWNYRRGYGNNYRGGQFNDGNGNRNYNRRGSNNYYQQPRRGPRGGRYDDSYSGGQRPYNEHNRGRGGYRGNRGGGHRGYNNNNGNGYQQVNSAPPSQPQ
jgi:hypothetical protein